MIETRKDDHISINLEREVSARGASGFDRFRFLHNALPELDPRTVDLSTEFLGHRLRAPILVSSMTGGCARGGEINRRLAQAAQELGCAMGVGSQRAMLEEPALADSYDIRDVAPDIPLFANLGAVQLNYGLGPDDCRRAVDAIAADALILHLNPVQEALQPEGDRDFSALLGKIERVCAALPVPVIVKEVGFGISDRVAAKLWEVGVAAIDVSGSGGTSWSAVEHFRADTALARRLSRTFVDWGIPTAAALRLVRDLLPAAPLIASGGLQTGLDAAKAIRLGADLAGYAGPLLRAAAQGEDETVFALRAIVEELRLAMFLCGAGSIEALRRADVLVGDGDPGARDLQSRLGPAERWVGWAPGAQGGDGGVRDGGDG